VGIRACLKTVLTKIFSVHSEAGTTSPAIQILDKVHFFYKKGSMERFLFFGPRMSERKARSESLAQR